MKEQKTNASDKSVRTPILGEISSDLNQFKKINENSDKKSFKWNWRKLLITTRDVGSIVLSLIKILQELGLIP